MNLPPRLLLAAALLAGTNSLTAQTPAVADPVVPLAKVEVREPRLLDMPAVVTRLTLDTLPPAQPGLVGFAEETANFSVASAGARSFGDIFAVRGLTNTPFFGDPSVSVYLDSVPLGSAFTFPAELAGFASGALLRGPGQNTRFGRAGPGGVVQLTTPAAVAAGQQQSELRAGYGNFNARDVAATTNAATADGRADVLVAAGYAARDGYVTNTTLNTDLDSQESASALARLRFRPATNTELVLLVTGQRARDGEQALVPLGGPLYTVARTSEGRTDLDALNASLTAAWETATGRISATTAHSDWDLGPYVSVQDFGPPAGELTNNVTLRQRLWTEEIRFAGDERAAAAWSGGALFSDGRTDSTAQRAFLATFGPIEDSGARVNQQALAAFGEVKLRAGTAFTLTPGLRVESSRKDIARLDNFVPAGNFKLNNNSSAVLPKLAATYTLSPQTTLFASVGAGYKPGGFSAFTSSASLAAFGPERTTAFEAGVTRTSADGRLTGTLRGFWYDIKGYQIERSFNATDYFVASAPQARSRGAELELEWRPAAGLTIVGGLGWTDVILRRFTAPLAPFKVFDGNRAPYVPNYDANLRVEYRDPTGWFAGVDASAVGKVFYDEGETAATAQRAHGLLGAHLGWESRRWRVSLYGENLTAERYYSSITAGIGHGTPGAPRTYGVQASVKF